jgi:hypothetical protein
MQNCRCVSQHNDGSRVVDKMFVLNENFVSRIMEVEGRGGLKLTVGNETRLCRKDIVQVKTDQTGICVPLIQRRQGTSPKLRRSGTTSSLCRKSEE